MTDKHLQQLLQSASQPQSDTDFTKKVMSQLPQSPIRWQVVWAIRLVTIILAAVIFCWITGFDFDPLQIIHHTSQIINHKSPITNHQSLIFIGLGISALTLYLCKQKQVL